MAQVDNDNSKEKGSRANRLLALGAFLGIAAALISILDVPGSRDSLPPDVAARVNGADITRAELDRALTALDSATRGTLTAADRDLVLSRLIEEELLAQRGVEIGLVDGDRRVRQAVVTAMVDLTVADARAEAPDEETLRQFYRDHIALFSTPDQLHLRVLFVPFGDDAEAAADGAEKATDALRAGGEFDVIAAKYGAPLPAPIPDAPASLAVLRRSLGPSLVQAATLLDEGAVSSPLETQTGFYVLQVVARQVSDPAPFEAVRDSVDREYRRRARDRALGEQIDFLQSRADIVIAPDLKESLARE